MTEIGFNLPTLGAALAALYILLQFARLVLWLLGGNDKGDDF